MRRQRQGKATEGEKWILTDMHTLNWLTNLPFVYWLVGCQQASKQASKQAPTPTTQTNPNL